MGTWETLLLSLLVLNALALGVIILVQQGKGADIGAAFGSGAANTVFGAQGAGSFLTKLTTWLAIGFFLISFGLAYLAQERAMQMDEAGMPAGITEPVPTSPQGSREGAGTAGEGEPEGEFTEIPDV